MAFCKKCGKELREGVAFCGGCGTTVVTSATPTTSESAPAPAPVTKTEEVVPAEETKIEETKVKKAIGKAKTKIVENGKESVINFILKRVLTCLLTIAVSAGTTLFVQHSFKDDFKKYYIDTLEPMLNDYGVIAEFVDMTETGTSPTEIMVYYRENDIKGKSQELYQKAISYSSDNEDIMRIHNIWADVCNDVLELASMTEAAAAYGQTVDVEYRAAVTTITAKIETFNAEIEIAKEKYNIE